MKTKKKFSLILFISMFMLCVIFSLTACGKGENAPVALSAPQIEIAENIISWTAVDNADGYEVYENGSKIKSQAETTYTITQSVPGTYSYTVKATSNDSNYTQSPLSNAVEYTVSAIQLAAPVLTRQDKTISWGAVENASGYEVYENGELVSSQTQTGYTIEKTAAGEYKYAVKAVSSDTKYTESQLSAEVTYIISTQLATPEIEIQGKVISWEAVENADFYAVYEDGYVILPSWSGTSYEITQTLVGIHTYCIMARSNKSSVFLNSNKSNEVSYDVQPTVLATPGGLTVVGGRLIWGAVENADKYIVYEDGIVVSEQADNFYPIPVNHDTGTFVYTVKALPARNDNQHLESELSAPYTYILSDDRQQLDEPQNLRKVLREEYKIPDHPEEGTVEVLYLLWNPVANAESYFIYEDGNRICATPTASYIIDEVIPGTHKYQVKAITSDPNFKPSELSTEYVEYKIDAKNVDFTVNLDITNAPDFNADVTVELWVPVNGLPQTDTQKRIVIRAGETSGIINFSNSARYGYIAKISSLPANYYATEVQLTAAATEGTIYIYAKGIVPEVSLNTERSLTATSGEQGTVGVEQLFLFVAPEKGQYSLIVDGSAICTANGIERRLFTADKGEAVLLGINCQSEGKTTFKVAKTTKQYINFGEITNNGPSGQSNFIYDGMETTTFYLHASTEPVRYMFLFTTATMGNTRFVTLTINGVDYEFDGSYCTSWNILIPASASETEITASLYGEAVGDGLASVAFFVIPLS